jgi:hypothetical protein
MHLPLYPRKFNFADFMHEGPGNGSPRRLTHIVCAKLRAFTAVLSTTKFEATSCPFVNCEHNLHSGASSSLVDLGQGSARPGRLLVV